MDGNGPFLWFGEYAPRAGYHRVPDGAMCVCAFVFVRRGKKILLGKWRPHPRLEKLTGMDPPRQRHHGRGLNLPARQMKFGEDPRDAARQIVGEILQIKRAKISGPRVEVDFWRLGKDASGPKRRQKLKHYDIWFFFDARLPAGVSVETPPWFAQLDWFDPRKVPARAYTRSHEDVVKRWLEPPRS